MFSRWPLKRSWRSLEFTNSFFANNLRSNWDRDAGLVSLCLSPQGTSINPRPDGPLDFPPPAGGCLSTPPSISAPGHRRTKRRTAFESSRKIVSKSFRSFFGSGQNWGYQGSKFQNFPKRFLDDKIINFNGRTTILIPSCWSHQGRVEPCIIWPWKVKVKIWRQVKSGQGHSVTEVGQIIYHSMRLAETNVMTAIPRLYLIWFSGYCQKTVGDLE